MAKKGRPRKEIDWDQFDKLCALQCTEKEIAQWFGMSVDTVERRCEEEYGDTFAEVFCQKKGSGKIALRRLQFQSAKKGNVAMQIWLGKQYLGQKDKQEVDMHGPVELVVKYDGNKRTDSPST